MEKVNYMMKCRVLFLHCVNVFFDDKSYFQDDFYKLLYDFLDEYCFDYFELFSLIFCFKKNKNGELSLYEEDSWQEILLDYVDYLIADQNGFLIKMYNDIKFSDVDGIGKLVELFYQYIVDNNNLKLVKFKQ